MVPTIISQQTARPLRTASATLARLERESQRSADATLALLEKSMRVLGTNAEGATDSLCEEWARQQASFEQTMTEILQERERITHERQGRPRHPDRSDHARVEQLRARAAALFAMNPTASVVWHTVADQQALGDILRLLDQLPERRNDPAYDDAVTFLRNLNAAYANNSQALLLRDQLRTITNLEAHAQLYYVIDSHQRHNPDRERNAERRPL